MSISDVSSHLTQGYTPSIILVVLAVVLLIRQRLALDLDPREPPVLKPKVPYIGHIIGVMKHHSGYHDICYARHSKPAPSATTLPMLKGKLYIITDPVMAQNAFRHKNFSFDPVVLDFAQRMLGVSDETMKPVSFQGDEKRPSYLNEMVKEVHASMLGSHLQEMNLHALENMGKVFNGIQNTLEVDSLYLWLRNAMTVATCEALLGSHNPIKANSDLVDALWDFEGGMMGLLLNIKPSLTFPTAYRARAKLQNALIDYYTAHHDLSSDVAQITKVRSTLMRRHGISDADMGRFELSLPHVSTANAIPTLFWHLCFIASSPRDTEVVRRELEGVVAERRLVDGGREVVIDISRFESCCPVLVSSYKETIRLANSQVGARRVMEDTMLGDGQGNEYLFRKGCDIQIPAGVQHLRSSTWGPDADRFVSTRFLSTPFLEKGEGREQKKSYFPFGGGKHLCPGRQFAFAEILGTVAVLVLGFDVVRNGDGGRIEVPRIERARLGEGVAKPTGEGLTMGARIRRREGWGDVVWRFTC